MEFGFIAPRDLQAYPGPPVRPIEELRPKRILEPAPGTWVFDFGQNFSGVARIRAKGPAGTTIRIRHAEMIYPGGRLMTENLRKARATDTFILRGDAAGESYSPRFSATVPGTGNAATPPLEYSPATVALPCRRGRERRHRFSAGGRNDRGNSENCSPNLRKIGRPTGNHRTGIPRTFSMGTARGPRPECFSNDSRNRGGRRKWHGLNTGPNATVAKP
jgi:hypothetical protein